MHIELVNHPHDEDMLDKPIMFDEVAQSQYNRIVRGGRSTSIASRSHTSCHVGWSTARSVDRATSAWMCGAVRMCVVPMGRTSHKMVSPVK
jgi:hypothetical protein